MRKSSFRFIIAALAATVALTACTKEITPPSFENDKVAPAAEGSRVITVTFGPQTKTVLDEDGLTPKFADGDSILLATRPQDKEAIPDTQTVAVIIDPSTQAATVTTTLQGELLAMYPARLAELSPKGRYSIPVREEQSGRFEDANVCRADISADSKVASFINVFPLLKITPPVQTQKLTIKSLPEIGADGQRTGETAHIISKGSNKYTVTVSGQVLSMPDTAYYVALQPGAGFENLSFEAWFDDAGTTGAVKGIVKEKLDIVREKDTIDGTSQIRAGWAYTINGTDWHEYVTVAGRKWATVNIGAESPTDVGEYFMWGEVSGHKYVSEAWTNFPADKPADSRYTDTWDNTKGFAWDNTPYCDGEEHFTKYVLETEKTEYGKDGFFDGKTTLDLVDDAAYVNWGGAWRMPTSTEYGGLIEYWDEKSGCIQIGEDLKFPELSCGRGLTFDNYTVYWTSSGHGQQPNYFGYYTDGPGLSSTNWDDRFYGGAIRAIIDEPDYDEIIAKK